MTEYEDWLQSQGITANMYAGYNPNEQAGLAQSYGNLQGSNNSNFLGMDNSAWSGLGKGVQLGTGLANALMGMKQLSMMEDKFAFDKSMAKKQYAMAKDAYDRNKRRAENIGAQMQAGTVRA